MIINKIRELLIEVLKELNYNDSAVEVTISNRKELCDYQYNGVFKLAKELGLSPEEIGNNISTRLSKYNEYFSKVEFCNPGFINITLTNNYINKLLNEMVNNQNFNISNKPAETIIIDYGGPNIAKPLHVGHLRSAIVGESIKRILKFLGAKALGDVHLGDYGLQIGEVIYGLKKEDIALEDVTLEDLERIYPLISNLCKEDEEVREECAKITKDLQDGNEEYRKYFEVIKKISLDDIKRIYKYLDVDFDFWYGEADSYDYIPKTTKLLEEKGILEESEGALVVNIKEDTDSKEMPPFIYQKSNGAYLYGTTDLATIYQRVNDYNPDRIIYVTDLRQNLHFESLFRVAKRIGFNIDYEHIGYGTVNGLDGKPYKTREGNSPKLDSLFKDVSDAFIASNPKNKDMDKDNLDKIVNAIIKFADLQNSYEKDYIFDISKFANINGKTGPYILYSYVRINKILKENKYNIDTLNNEIYNSEDRNLRVKLLELESAINKAYELRSPSIVANYLYDLSVLMNLFYEKNRINTLEDEIIKNNWLFILTLATRVLKECLSLLMIEIPNEM